MHRSKGHRSVGGDGAIGGELVVMLALAVHVMRIY